MKKRDGDYHIEVTKTEHSSESAAKHMTGNVPLAYPTETIAEVESTILKHSARYDTIHYIYVLNEKHQLVGVMSIKEMFRSPKTTKVEKIMNRNLVFVHPHTDQEHVAMKALRNGVKAIPVIDKDNKLLGVVTSDKVLAILHAEHTEDFLRLAGVHTFKDPAMSIINAPAIVHIKKRLPWLFLGLLGGLVAASIVRHYDEVLQTEIILAAFIPSIVYLADAVGTQTQTIFIRAMSLDHRLNIKSYLLREVFISLTIASLLAGVTGVLAFVWWREIIFVSIFGISTFLTIITAMAVAIVLPYLFIKIKVDPAIASGPFATIIRDIVSLLIYFSTSQLLLGNFI